MHSKYWVSFFLSYFVNDFSGKWSFSGLSVQPRSILSYQFKLSVLIWVFISLYSTICQIVASLAHV